MTIDPKYYQIKEMKWYGSFDPFFNRFPRAKTPKVYKITEEELSEHLQDSVPLKCDLGSSSNNVG